MNTISIERIDIQKHKISIWYTVDGEWSCLFGPEDYFWVEYDSDISNVPKSVAVVTIMGSLLTLSWLYDGKIIVDELDKDFYESIPEFKSGYKKMYPSVEFKGSLSVNRLVENTLGNQGSACLFSGGVDAFNTLISHIDERPTLLTVWGADIAYNNTEGWEAVNNHISATAEQFGLKHEIIHSNFRKIIDEGVLDRELPKRTGDMWWHGFHSGTGMLTLMAPYTLVNGIDKVYIASSFTKDFWGRYTCSSDPVIDNYIRYNRTRVIHDGYEFHRQDKIHRICEYSKKHGLKVPLRVCWKSSKGQNCCNCEKCYRTILGIFAENEDPHDYGFDYEKTDFVKMMERLQYEEILLSQYIGIPERLRENYKIKNIIKPLRWIYRMRIDGKTNEYIHKKNKTLNKKEYLYSKAPELMKVLYDKIKNKLEVKMNLFHKIKSRFHYYKDDVIFSRHFLKMPWKKRIILIQTPDHTNIGDNALVLAEKYFFKDNLEIECIEVTYSEYYRYKKIITFLIRNRDIIAIHAGGNMGIIWKGEENCRRDIIKTFGNNKIISMPQTIFYDDSEEGQRSLQESIEIYSKHKNLILIAREKYSYNLMKKSYKNNAVYLMPDIALYLTYNNKYFERQDIMLCLRNDAEKALNKEESNCLIKYLDKEKYYCTDMYCKETPTIDNRVNIVYNKLDEFAKADMVITDRLHGMVFAAITETPCVVLSNNHHKIKGVYDWLKDLQYIEYVEDVNEVPEAIKKVMSVKERHYDNKKLMPYFEQIIDAINQ